MVDEPAPGERLDDLAAVYLAATAPLGALVALLRLKQRLDDEDLTALAAMASSAVRDRLLRGGRPDLADAFADVAAGWIELAREQPPPPAPGPAA